MLEILKLTKTVHDRRGNLIGSVRYINQLGSDDTVYKAAKVCVGQGFDAPLPKDESAKQSLISTLYRLKHLRVFEFAGITFGVECPIFVERQLRTYRKPEIERSLRYCDPLELDDTFIWEQDEISKVKKELIDRYRKLRESGYKKEEARRILPVDTWTQTMSFYTLRSLFHVFDERIAPAAQSETNEFVKTMYEIAIAAFPLSMKAYEQTKEKKEKTV